MQEINTCKRRWIEGGGLEKVLSGKMQIPNCNTYNAINTGMLYISISLDATDAVVVVVRGLAGHAKENPSTLKI